MSRSGWIRQGGLWLTGAVAAVAVALSCGALGTPAMGPQNTAQGRTMVGSVNMRKLGDVGPSNEGGPASRSSVDSTPIVLWAGTAPAAVLRYETDSNNVTNKVNQRIVRIDGGRGGPFPLVASDTLPSGATTEDALDLWDPAGIRTADLDGDGVDELVLLRGLGAAEAHGVQKTLFKTTWFAPHTRRAGYALKSTFLDRPGDRDVILALFERKPFEQVTDAQLAKDGLADKYLLARIDETGPKRIALLSDQFRPNEILAVGALSRPGSSGLDELLVLSRPNGHMPPALFSRHAPDGRLLAPPRQLYVPYTDSGQTHFELVPQSTRAVAFERSKGRVYFFAPDMPANWARMVELNGLGPSELTRTFLGVVGPQSLPKAIVELDGGVFAFDEEGTTFLPDGAGWKPTKKPEPFYRVTAPSPKHQLASIQRSREAPDSFLMVHGRTAEVRELTEEELLAAAERFAPPRQLARWRRALEPSLERSDRNRDDWIDEERRAKQLDRPKTVEEWQRTLPDSYRRWTANARMNFRITLQVELLSSSVEPNPAGFQHFDEFLGWRHAQQTPAETVLTWIRRGAPTATLRIPARLALLDSPLRLPSVDARATASGLAAVLALAPGEPGKNAAGYYFVTGP